MTLLHIMFTGTALREALTTGQLSVVDSHTKSRRHVASFSFFYDAKQLTDSVWGI